MQCTMQKVLLASACLLLVQTGATPSSSDVISDDAPMQSRLIGGLETTKPESYVVLIKGKDIAATEVATCGGAIIQTNMVLTTAFCVLTTVSGKVVAGTNTAADTTPQEVDIAGVIIHPDFRKNTMENDIAIVRVLPSFDVSIATIQVVKLASIKLVDKDALAGKDVTIFGWGFTDALGAGPAATKLNSLVLPAGKDKDCAAALKNVYFKMPTTSFCVNATKATTICGVNDFGSPVVAKLNTKLPDEISLVGLASRYVKCPNKKGAPNVVTRVGPFLKWIQANNGPAAT